MFVAMFFRQLLRKELLKALLFGGGWISCQAKTKGVVDALRFGFRTVRQKAFGQGIGEFKISLAVEQGERLQWCVGAEAARAGAERIRRIKDRESWMRRRPPKMCVEAATVAIRASAWRPGPFDLAKGHDAIRLRWKNRRAAQLGSEQAAGGEGDVADDFGVEPQAGLASEQVIIGIDQVEFRPRTRGLALGGGSNGEAMDGLEAAFLSDQLGREPIE